MSAAVYPEDVEAEKSLIATIATGQFDRSVYSRLTPLDFMHPAHRAVFTALLEVAEDGLELNPFTIRDRMRTHGSLGKVGDYPGLMELLMAEEVANPEILVGLLLRLRQVREIMAFAHDLHRRAIGQAQGPDELLQEAEAALVRIGELGAFSGELGGTMGEIIQDLQTMQPFTTSNSVLKLVTFGIPSLDRALECGPGSLNIIAGRPGEGKTAWMVQMACRTAMQGIPVLIVSLELKVHALKARVAAWFSGINYRDFRHGDVYDEDHEAGIGKLLLERDALPLIHYVCRPAGRPWAEVESIIRNYVRKYGIRTVFLDYFGRLARPKVQKGSNEASAWADISLGISAVTGELDLCFNLLAQLGRDADGKEPTLSDLRATGQLEADCNSAILLWSHGHEHRATVAKNREDEGKFTLTVDFHGGTNRVYELERTTDSKGTAKKRSV